MPPNLQTFLFLVFLNPWVSILKVWLVFCLGSNFLSKSILMGCAVFGNHFLYPMNLKCSKLHNYFYLIPRMTFIMTGFLKWNFVFGTLIMESNWRTIVGNHRASPTWVCVCVDSGPFYHDHHQMQKAVLIGSTLRDFSKNFQNLAESCRHFHNLAKSCRILKNLITNQQRSPWFKSSCL